MRAIPPQPFTFEAGSRAVLLLHSFTGSPNDVRELGRYLESKGYTCHAPQYKGHGVTPEELLQATYEDWWQDVLDGYHFLKKLGYEQIAVAGLSLGGVFSLKLGYTLPIKGIISLCTPLQIKSEQLVYKNILHYAEKCKRRTAKDEAEVAAEMKQFKELQPAALKTLHSFIANVRKNINKIICPTFVVQARNDEMIYPENAVTIYESVATTEKTLKWYENSTHIITAGAEKELLHYDIYKFLEKLNW